MEIDENGNNYHMIKCKNKDLINVRIAKVNNIIDIINYF